MQAGLSQGIVGSPGHSPALKYELRLKEELVSSGQAGPTAARAAMCFEILDELLPQLGVFQRAMRLIRNELHGSVYSSHHFTSGGKYGSKKGAQHKPEQLPFFEIARKCMEERNEKISKLKEEITSLKEQLYTCEADLEKASSAAESCRHDIKDRETKIHKLNSGLRAQTAECERLQKIVNQHQRAQDRLRQEVEYRIFSLKNTIASLTGENAELRRYKSTHDNLQEVLSKPRTLAPVTSPDPPATTEPQLERQIETAVELQKQLLHMQNVLTDEYDVFLNSHVAEMADELATDVHKMIRQKQRKFKENIAEILNEVHLLQSHITTLESRQSQVSSIRTQFPEEHMSVVVPDHPLNPFLPQQHTLSKYAIMVLTSSDNGESFFPLKGSQFCPNCGDKTTVCPHKALVASGLLVQLPLHSTHLKLVHPPQHVIQGQPQPKEVRSPEVISKPASEHTETPKQKPDFQRIWSYYKSMFKTEQGISRDLSPVRSLVDQLTTLLYLFYAAVLHQDDVVSILEERVPSLLESLFKFMHQRYLVDEVVSSALHDFIAALQKHYTQNKEFLILSLSLCGQVEGSVFRYLLLLASLVDVLPWKSMKEFAPWASIVYPMLQEEDVEQLAMNFTAHSSNRVSKVLIMDYLTWLLLRHKEPRVLQMEIKLQEYPSRKPGGMMEAEFAETMASLVPLTPDHLCHRLYMQSLAHIHSADGMTVDTVPVKKLAYSAAYLSLLQSTPAQLAELEQFCHTQAAVVQPGAVRAHLPSGQTGKLYTIAAVRAMANRMK